MRLSTSRESRFLTGKMPALQIETRNGEPLTIGGECCADLYGNIALLKNLLDPPTVTKVAPKPRRRETALRARRFNRMLVPIDFSRPSLKAIPYALAISHQSSRPNPTHLNTRNKR
jgi:hypothetical protein